MAEPCGDPSGASQNVASAMRPRMRQIEEFGHFAFGDWRRTVDHTSLS